MQLSRTRPKATTLLVVERRPLLRLGIAQVLGRTVGLRVVASAAPSTALAALRRLRPEVVLVVTCPAFAGERSARLIRRASERGARVLVLADDARSARCAVDAGALGFLLTHEIGADQVRRAVGRALWGQATMSPRVRAALKAPCPLSVLSAREREVLVLVALGLEVKEIASRLGVSPRTVDTFRVRLRQKLRVKSTAALTQLALAHALTEH